jgi:hypothetical protein
MKLKTTIVYEVGDHVEVIDNGMIGTIRDVYGDIVEVDLIDEDEIIDFEPYELKYLTKTEYKARLKKIPKLSVQTLMDDLLVVNGVLKVGCQEISFSDANKIADFIKKNCKKR